MSYARGAARERQAAEWYREQGCVVYRSAGSHGAADLVVIQQDSPCVRLVQVKANRGSPWGHFGPGERDELLSEARGCGAAAVLLWWPPDRRGPREISSNDWPTRLLQAA